METVQLINLILTCITTAFGLLMAVCKPFRNLILRKKKETEVQRETNLCLLRDRITSAYFKHHLQKELREYEFENVARLYQQYKALGGNSFVDKIWKEIQTWHVLP